MNVIIRVKRFSQNSARTYDLFYDLLDANACDTGGSEGTCGPHGVCKPITTPDGINYNCECNFDANEESKYCVLDGELNTRFYKKL